VTGTLYPTGPFFLVQMFAPGADMTPGTLVNAGIRQVRRTGSTAPVGSNPVGSRIAATPDLWMGGHSH
jgi:hypothetical protein